MTTDQWWGHNFLAVLDPDPALDVVADPDRDSAIGFTKFKFLHHCTVGAESLCRCRWKVRYLKPLDLWSQMTLKFFHYEFERWICRPLSWYNMNCLEFVIILLPVPKVNKLSVPIFLKKKEILPLMGGKFFFFNWREMFFDGLRWVWSVKERHCSKVGP